MTTAKIPITQEHIDRGEQSKCERCVFALAVNGCLKTDCHSAVGPEATLVFRHYDELGVIANPLTVREIVLDFDKGKPVHPQTIHLPIPERLVSAFRPEVLEPA